MAQRSGILELFSEREEVLYLAQIQLNYGEERGRDDARGSNLPA